MLERPFLTGSWNDRIVAHMPDGSLWTLFEVNPMPYGPNRCAGTCATLADTSHSAKVSAALQDCFQCCCRSSSGCVYDSAVPKVPVLQKLSI